MSSHIPEFKLKSEIIMNAIAVYLVKPIFDANALSPCQDPLLIGVPETNISSLYCSALSYLYSFDVVNRNHQNDTSVYPVYPILDAQGISEVRILSYIKGNVSTLGGQFGYQDVSLAVATGANAASEYQLLRDLELDMYSTGMSPYQLKYNIIYYLTGNDAPSISTSLYNLMNFPWASSTRGEIDLSNAIELFRQNNTLEGTLVAEMINNAVAALSDDFTYYDIINAIVSTIDAQDNLELVNYFTLDFIAYAVGGINGPANYSPQQLQAVLANISGNSAASITGSIYFALGNTWATSVAGALSLNEGIIHNHDVDNIDYPAILNNVQSNVTALNGDFANNDLAGAIAMGINSQDDRLLDNLKVDIDQSVYATGLTPVQIQANIAQIGMVSGSSAEITANIYAALMWGNGTLGIDAQDLLTYAVNDYIAAGGVNVSAALNDSIASLNPQTVPLNDVSLAIAYTIKAQSNVELINLLEVSVDSPNFGVAGTQSALVNITGDDGASIATSIFFGLEFPYISTNQGLVRLMHAIQEFDRSDNQLVFPAAIADLKESAGEQYLNFIVPYYNYCAKLDNVTFNVTGSIVDISINNTNSSVYDAIGNTALFLYNGGITQPNVYLTFFAPVGTTGNADETSCEEVSSNELILIADVLLGLSALEGN